MKEEYVTYSQAVKLKELGFDWKCRDFYPITGALGIKRNCSHTNFNSFQMSFDSKYGEIFSAPRLDQAQKWLREKHNLSVEPICNMVRQWNVNVCEIDNFGTAVYSKINLDTYELALSAGIDAALELLTLNTK